LTSDSNGPGGSFNRNDNIIIIVIIIIIIIIITVALCIPQMNFETVQIRDNRGCFAIFSTGNFALVEKLDTYIVRHLNDFKFTLKYYCV